jgi:hypothetical protein
MASPKGQSDDERRDAVLLRMLKTPPKPHDEMKLGKSKAKPTERPQRKQKKAASPS